MKKNKNKKISSLQHIQLKILKAVTLGQAQNETILYKHEVSD